MLQIPAGTFDAVIFDLDGTMVDNMSFHLKAWQEFLLRHGKRISSNDYTKDISGRTNYVILRHYFGELPKEEVRAMGREKETLYRGLYAGKITPIEGLLEFLKRLEVLNKKVAVATSAPKANCSFVLDGLGLGSYFPVVVNGDEILQSKPAPDIYIETAKRMGAEPSRCIVFEDSPIGFQAAQSAGMHVIALTTSHEAVELPDAIGNVSSFNEIQI